MKGILLKSLNRVLLHGRRAWHNRGLDGCGIMARDQLLFTARGVFSVKALLHTALSFVQIARSDANPSSEIGGRAEEDTVLPGLSDIRRVGEVYYCEVHGSFTEEVQSSVEKVIFAPCLERARHDNSIP
jgi:hypothetical protein